MKRIELKVIAKAKKENVEKISEYSYKIKVSSPPEKGKANDKVIELLSDALGVKKNSIKIISGKTSKRKIIEIDDGR
jgi:uncharacterized protein